MSRFSRCDATTFSLVISINTADDLPREISLDVLWWNTFSRHLWPLRDRYWIITKRAYISSKFTGTVMAALSGMRKPCSFLVRCFFLQSDWNCIYIVEQMSCHWFKKNRFTQQEKCYGNRALFCVARFASWTTFSDRIPRHILQQLSTSCSHVWQANTVVGV